MTSQTEREIVKEAAEDAAVAAVQASWPHTRAVARVVMVTIFIVLGIIAAIFVVRALTSVILLVVLSIFFAYLVAPLVEFVRRPFNMLGQERAMPRAIAIGIVYVVIFASLGLFTYILIPRINDQLAEFAQQAPTYIASARARVQKLNEIYQAYNLPPKVREAVTKKFTDFIETVGGYTVQGSLNLLINVVVILPELLLIPILAFFLLKDAESFRRSALQMLPSGRWRWRGDEFFQDINRTLAAYIRAQLIACLLIGVLCTLGFLVLDMPYALSLGVMAGLLEFIPLVGPLLIAIIATLIASFYSFKLAVGVLVFLAVLRIIHDYVTYPRIIRQGIHLHPLAVILAILSGAALAGITGIFLAIPVVAIATVTYRHWIEHRGGAGLVADLLMPNDGDSSFEESPVDAEPNTPTTVSALGDDEPHPTIHTTPDEMARLRPDLTSGELKMPDLD